MYNSSVKIFIYTEQMFEKLLTKEKIGHRIKSVIPQVTGQFNILPMERWLLCFYAGRFFILIIRKEKQCTE